MTDNYFTETVDQAGVIEELKRSVEVAGSPSKLKQQQQQHNYQEKKENLQVIITPEDVLSKVSHKDDIDS